MNVKDLDVKDLVILLLSITLIFLAIERAITQDLLDKIMNALLDDQNDADAEEDQQ